MNKSDTAMRMAYEMADEIAISDIELYCDRMKDADGYWYDTRLQGDGHIMDMLQRAVTYLEARSKLRRHPEDRLRVQFIPAASDK